jgi:dethiobiotin synthetase
VSILVITGTGTGVGKTVVAAAVAVLARDAGLSVAYVKPAQTGLDYGVVDCELPSDAEVVCSLSGLELSQTYEFARYPDPLSPAAAARVSGWPSLDLRKASARIRVLARDNRLVIVEGAGGLLVRYDDDGATIADLAKAVEAPVLVVVSASLGTLNHTALTLEALAHRGLDLAGVVIGAWPSQPDLAARSNVTDLEMLAARPLSGALPLLGSAEFLELARAGLSPALGGRFDPADFRASATVTATDASRLSRLRRDAPPRQEDSL